MKTGEVLQTVINIATSDGNWNYDPYLHGMANGLILAQAIIDETDPEYLDAPKVWLKDIPNNNPPLDQDEISTTA